MSGQSTRWDLLATRAKLRWQEAQRDVVQAKEALEAARRKQQQVQHMVNAYHGRAQQRHRSSRLVGDVSLGMNFLGQLGAVLHGAEGEVATCERRLTRAQALAADARLALEKMKQLDQRQSQRQSDLAKKKEQHGFDQLALMRYHGR